MKRVSSFASILVGLVGLTASFSAAATITYAPPPIVRPDLTYTTVTESNSQGLQLYGPPTASSGSDVLSFNSLDFRANSAYGSPGAFTDGQLNLVLQANGSKTIQSIAYSEGGDYNVTKPPTATGVNRVQVYKQAFQITVLAAGGSPLAMPLHDNTSVSLTYYNNLVLQTSPNGLVVQTSDGGSDIGSWSGSATINLAAIFGRTDITQVAISYNNQLSATSTDGIAAIAKKFVDISPTLTGAATPEPTTLGLVAVGCLFIRRRRR